MSWTEARLCLQVLCANPCLQTGQYLLTYRYTITPFIVATCYITVSSLMLRNNHESRKVKNSKDIPHIFPDPNQENNTCWAIMALPFPAIGTSTWRLSLSWHTLLVILISLQCKVAKHLSMAASILPPYKSHRPWSMGCKVRTAANWH